jgi:endonuclease-3
MFFWELSHADCCSACSASSQLFSRSDFTMKTRASEPEPSTPEEFDIDRAFQLLREAVKPLPKAAMFDLRDRGFNTPFEQLVGSLISARTRDETTIEVCLRLFAAARTPEAIVSLGEARLIQLLRGATFPEPKARDLVAIARRLIGEFDGKVPADYESLTSFRGVGPKIAALTLAVGFGQPMISVDIHVHRITNRWGYVRTRSPEQTMKMLEAQLPRKYWIEINERLVPFGKFICTGGAPPLCSTCLLRRMCSRVGVTRHR